MSKSNVLQLSAALKRRKRVFHLGSLGYSGAPGLSWCTEYWVAKGHDTQLNTHRRVRH